jgi:CRP/FNR family cyclic AMP-dependent transcriptional regulator
MISCGGRLMLDELQRGFLRDIPASCKPLIEGLATEVHSPPGSCLFAEGDAFPDFQVVLEGHVRLEMNVPGRGRMAILTLGPGDILGWSAVLSQGKMTATATALDTVRTASIPGDRLRQLCDAQPEFGYHFMKQLAAALSRRLLATRLQMLDLFADHEPIMKARAGADGSIDPEC